MNFPEFHTFLGGVHYFIYETTRFVTPLAISAEWVLVLLGALLVTLAPNAWARPLGRVHGWYVAFAHRRRLAVLVCGLLPALIRLSLLGVLPVPEPSIHDEFSHLLAGDTLAHGRFSNPTHPLWKHFESIHILQKPRYASMYPPGPGLFLALGQLLFHEPWAGVVISVCLMCAATCWMMQGWLSAEWALFGTLIMILKIGVVGFWMNGYLSGAVGALAGALLFGSAVRLRHGSKGSLRNSALLGAALVLLMNSRPLDGALLGLAALCYVVWPVLRRANTAPRLRPAIVAPGLLVLLAGLLFTAIYDKHVTGSYTKLPYQANRETYGWPENLSFLKPVAVKLDDPVLQAMYRKEVQHRERVSTPKRAVNDFITRFFDSWTFLIGPLLTVPLVFLPRLVRDRRTRPLVIFVLLVAGLNLFQMVLYPYHLAPVVPVIFAIVAEASGYLYAALRRLRPQAGYAFCIALLLALVLIGGMKQEAEALEIPLAYWERAYEAHRDPRAAIQSWLSARPGQQLVIVRYKPDHSPDQEWVYNEANIDASKVVWARERDRESNAELLRYFHDRQAWLLEADVYPQRVVPYVPLPSEDAE